MAFSTFYIAFIMYFLNVINVYLMVDDGDYNKYIVDENESNYDYFCILVWLYYGYLIDSIG